MLRKYDCQNGRRALRKTFAPAAPRIDGTCRPQRASTGMFSQPHIQFYCKISAVSTPGLQVKSKISHADHTVRGATLLRQARVRWSIIKLDHNVRQSMRPTNRRLGIRAISAHRCKKNLRKTLCVQCGQACGGLRKTLSAD